MENAGKLIEEEELREQIKGAGIGTSATRAEIIKKLEKIKYIDINTKTQIITPTQKGEFIYDSMKIEKKNHIVRDNMLRVIDINLDFLTNIDYNVVKKGNKYNIEKLLYFFICNDIKLLDNIYEGDIFIRDVSKIFNIDIEDLDKQLYYDYDEYMKEVSYD